MNLQKTIKEPIELEGIGLHNGIKVNLSLKPAEANSGIKFKRTDIDSSKNIIEANYNNVSSPILCTKIKNSQGVTVSTIEHLMAVFYGEGIDNILVELDAPEVPIMDGSSFDFAEAIKSAGIEEQKYPKKFIKVLKKVPQNTEAEKIQTMIYTAGKENGYSDNLRSWFKLIYEVTFGEENGPRMGFFISFFGVKETIDLMEKKLRI